MEGETWEVVGNEEGNWGMVVLYQDYVWRRTGEITRWPWKWMEICNWPRWGGRGYLQEKTETWDKGGTQESMGWPYLWLTTLGIWNLNRSHPLVRQEPDEAIGTPTHLPKFNTKCIMSIRNACIWEGAETGGMSKQQLSELETHTMWKH